ncbi:hypothetical protein D3C81_2141790 [compost metagenome]
MPASPSRLVRMPLLPRISSQDWPTMISGITIVSTGRIATRFFSGKSKRATM